MTSGVPGFLSKTFEIFSSAEYADCCGWGASGDTIIIRKIEQFSKEVLPKYFKHSNFQSFVRQLNMYDFHKTVQDPSHGEFRHEFFRKDMPELLVNIKRKANKPADAAGAAGATGTTADKSTKGSSKNSVVDTSSKGSSGTASGVGTAGGTGKRSGGSVGMNSAVGSGGGGGGGGGGANKLTAAGAGGAGVRTAGVDTSSSRNSAGMNDATSYLGRRGGGENGMALFAYPTAPASAGGRSTVATTTSSSGTGGSGPRQQQLQQHDNSSAMVVDGLSVQPSSSSMMMGIGAEGGGGGINTIGTTMMNVNTVGGAATDSLSLGLTPYYYNQYSNGGAGPGSIDRMPFSPFMSVRGGEGGVAGSDTAVFFADPVDSSSSSANIAAHASTGNAVGSQQQQIPPYAPPAGPQQQQQPYVQYPPMPSSSSSQQQQLLPENIVSESDHVLMEMHHQESVRQDFERRMEQKLARLEGENSMLKHMFMESHSKNALMQARMEKVLRTIYNLFVERTTGTNATGANLIAAASASTTSNGETNHEITAVTSAGVRRGRSRSGSGSVDNKFPLNSPTSFMLFGGEGNSAAEYFGRQNSQSSEVSHLLNAMQAAVATTDYSSTTTSSYGTAAAAANTAATTSSSSSTSVPLGPPLAPPYVNTKSSTAAGVGSDQLGTATVGESITRFDSMLLDRLPSLDIDGLQSLSGSDLLVSSPGAGNTSSSNGNNDAGDANYNNSNNNNNNSNSASMPLLNRQYAGQLLSSQSRSVNSFDMAASSVSAPLQHLASFDAAAPYDYGGSSNIINSSNNNSINTRGIAAVANDYTNTSNSHANDTEPRVTQLPDSPPESISKNSKAIDSSSIKNSRKGKRNNESDIDGNSSSSSKKEDSSGPGNDSIETAATGNEGKNKRLKMTTDVEGEGGGGGGGGDVDVQVTKEQQSLASEDVYSSLNEAHQFMDLLTRNQQTTLTRLDSLEHTLASMLDTAATDPADTASGKAADSSSNGIDEIEGDSTGTSKQDPGPASTND